MLASSTFQPPGALHQRDPSVDRIRFGDSQGGSIRTWVVPSRILLILVFAFIFAHQASAQERLHQGRITRSFTEPVEQSIAASAETGIIVESNVQEGDRVNVGDVLAKLNQRVLVESLEIAKARAESTARLDAAKSQLELVKSQRAALNSLVSGGHTNRYEVEQKESEYQAAYAELRAAQDELQLNKLEVNRIKAQIADRTIRCPINGFVTEIHKQLGENVSGNEPQFATIVRVDQLKVRFYLDAQTLRSTPVGHQLTILVSDQRVPTTATVTFVSPVIDSDSGLGRLDVKIDNREMTIQSGTICFWDNDSSRVKLMTSQRVGSGVSNSLGDVTLTDNQDK